MSKSLLGRPQRSYWTNFGQALIPWEGVNMARTVEDAPITTSASRRKLNARAKPRYRTIEPDLHLGFRKGETGGRWVVHYYTGQGKYRVETFAKAVTDDADGLPAAGLALIWCANPIEQFPLTWNRARSAFLLDKFWTGR